MKINNLLEGITAASSPENAESPAPHFGRSDKFLEEKDEEKVEECTTSGSIASVASPVGGMQRRGKGSIFAGIKTSDKYPNSKTVKEADEWEEEGDKFQRFLAYAQKQLKAADPAQRISLARRLSVWQVKHFGPENNQSYNPNTGAAIQGNSDITPSIRAILEIVNRPSAGGGLPFVTVPPIPGTQQVEIDNTWRLTDEGKQWLAYAKEELEKFKLYSSEFMEVARALSIQQQKKFGRASMNPRDNTTLEISMLIDQIRRESWQATQQANQNVIDAAWTVNDLMDQYNNASPEEKEVFRANVERDYGMSVQEFFDYLQEHDQLPQARRQPAQSSPADDVFAEAKKANTKTARKEFGKRVKAKPSDKEKETKQSESDRLWDMLQAHIAAAEKDKEVKEANQFFKPGPQTTGKFPEPRERKPGEAWSKSETLGKDGRIYHWQDPRAKQGVGEAVTLDRSKNPNYPNDPATIQHHIDSAKAILSDPKSDPDSRKAASAILAQHKGLEEAQWWPDREYIPKAPRKRKPQVGNRVQDIRTGSPKIYYKNGKAVGEVGIDPEASPGNGSYYMKHYLSGRALIGYDTPLEASKELSHLVRQESQGVAGEQVNEKSVSKAQFKTMAAVAHNPEFAKKVGISQKVGKEFHKADKKSDYEDLPSRADEGFADVVKGVKRAVKGKEHPDVVASKHLGRALGHYHQGSLPDAEKETKRYNKVQSMNKGIKTLPYPMKEEGVAEEKQRLDPKCWTGYKKQGTKMKGGVRVNNCVKVDEAELAEEMLAQQLYRDLQIFKKGDDKGIANRPKDKEIGNKPKDKDIVTKESANPAQQAAIAIAKKKEQGVKEDWQKTNKQDKTDGMSPKAVKAYRRENPGSKLQTAVTTKPSKLKAGSKDAKRRKSFCARMSGNPGPMKDEKGRPTPKAKALRRWNCE